MTKRGIVQSYGHDYIRIIKGTRGPPEILASANYSLRISTGHPPTRNNNFVKSLVADLLCCVSLGIIADVDVEIVALNACTLVRGRKYRFGQSLHPWLSQSIVHDLESQHQRAWSHFFPAVILALLFDGPQDSTSPGPEIIQYPQLRFGRQEWNDLFESSFRIHLFVCGLYFRMPGLFCTVY